MDGMGDVLWILPRAVGLSYGLLRKGKKGRKERDKLDWMGGYRIDNLMLEHGEEGRKECES